MQDEEQIRSILISLLKTGLLRIRALGFDGEAELCALEADHLHNLPDILQIPKTDLLAHYYNVHRPAFMGLARDTSAFESDWLQLGAILEKHAQESARPPIL
jgi:hypothetical protein